MVITMIQQNGTWWCIEASGKSNSSPGRTGCSSMSAVVSRYQKVYNAPGFYWASYYVAFRYVSQYKYPRGDASDKSDFSYDLPLYAHPTDTNGYREMRPLFSSLSLFLSISLPPLLPFPSPSLIGPMCSIQVLVTGGTCEKLQSAVVRCRSMQMKGSIE